MGDSIAENIRDQLRRAPGMFGAIVSFFALDILFVSRRQTGETSVSLLRYENNFTKRQQLVEK